MPATEHSRLQIANVGVSDAVAQPSRNRGDGDSGQGRRAASGRQIKTHGNNDDSWCCWPKLQNHVEQLQLDDAGGQRMLQQEMAQRTVVVRVRQRRLLMRRSIRLCGVLCVMMSAARVLFDRLGVGRATRVLGGRVFVRVDDRRRGRNQQRTRCQPRHQASSQTVKHDSHPSWGTFSTCPSLLSQFRLSQWQVENLPHQTATVRRGWAFCWMR